MPPSFESPVTALHANIVAVILAGGASTRMGVDKAFLNWEETPLLRRQIDVVRAAEATMIWISGRREVDYSAFDCEVVNDQVEGAGPLAGLAAALRKARDSHSWLMALAVDLPCMTSDYLSMLAVEAINTGVGILPQRGSYFEPLAALYPVGPTLAVAEAQLAIKHFALQELAAILIAQGHAQPRPIEPNERVLFANWNDATGPRTADTG